MRVLVTGLPDKPHASAGQVLDLPEAEAQDMLVRGTAVKAAAEEPPAELPGEPEPAKPELEMATAPATPVAVAPKKSPREPKKPKG